MNRIEELEAELRKMDIKANDECRYNRAHTEKEITYLERSVAICQELHGLNRGYKDEQEKWLRKKALYEEDIQQIRRMLHPSQPDDIPAQGNIDIFAGPPDLSKPKDDSDGTPKDQKKESKDTEEKTVKEKWAAAAKDKSKDKKYAAYIEKYGSPIPAEDYVSPYASKEVAPELIRSWYQDFPGHDLDSVVGMENLKTLVKKEILNKIGWEQLEDIYDMPTLKSYLFFGPYGTGKTFFIEGFAMELMKEGFKFLRLRGSDIHTKYVGGGEKAVKAAFHEAKDHAPCVLFFDELDEVCKNRGGSNVEGHTQRLTTEFIQEYDLLKTSKDTVVVLTASNYPDRIDGAMRSRIRTNYIIPLPEENLRKNYFIKQLQKFQLSDDISYEYMADQTDNCSMRDVEQVANYIKDDILEKAKERFGIRDENGRLSPELSLKVVDQAIQEGKITITKELFDKALMDNMSEQKEDIIASLHAFIKKK